MKTSARADRLSSDAMVASGRSFPSNLNAVDSSTDVDLVDDDRQIQPADLGQRREGLGQPGLRRASRRSMISALGESRAFRSEQPGGLILQQFQMQPAERRSFRQQLLGGARTRAGPARTASWPA